jgi:iron complex transport system permease protein
MFGSLARAGWPEIAVVAPFLLLTLVLLPRHAAALNVLQLGEAEAGYLGIDVERLKRMLMLWVLLAVGGSVALAGAIGFVGLIAPHLVRLLVGADQRRLMPASALLGASLLTLADLVARTVAAPADLPIGILTALIGGPFFLLLLLRLRGDGSLVERRL